MNTLEQPTPYPHTQVILAVLGLVVIGGSLLWYNPSSQKSDTQVSMSDDISIVNKLSSDNLNSDADHDGVPAWRAALLLPSEISNNRSAQEQFFASSTPEEKASIARLQDVNNLTAQFAKNAYTVSQNISEEDIANVSNNGLATDLIKAETAKMYPNYTVSDVTKVTKSTPVTELTYLNTLAVIMGKVYVIAQASDERELLNTYYTTKNATPLARIQKKADSLTPYITQLRNLPVPAPYAETHLIVLKKVATYQSILESFAKIDEDPLRGYIALQDVQGVIASIVSAIKQIMQIADSRDIVVSPRDAAYNFTQL